MIAITHRRYSQWCNGERGTNTVGIDVAIEALRDCIRDRRATVDELLHFARICRVENVMRPYLEALQAL